MYDLDYYLSIINSFLHSDIVRFGGWMLLGLSTPYATLIYFWIRKKDVSREEFEHADPAYARIHHNYAIASRLWFALAILIHIAVGAWLKARLEIDERDLFVHMTASCIACIALFDGIFAIRTGIYSAKIKSGFRYVYGDSEHLRRVGKTHIAYSLTVALVALGSLFIAP